MLLTGCHGVTGIISGSSTSGNGVVVTEVRTRGIEFRNVPGGIGIHLGSRDSVYVQPSTAGDPSSPTGERHGFVPLTAEDPVYFSSTGWGIELAWDDSFRGFSLGLRSQATALLPQDGSAVLIVDPTNPDPTRRFLHCQYP